MKIFFETDTNLPFQKGEIQYERAIIGLEEEGCKEIEIEANYGEEGNKEIPIWGDDFYPEDENGIIEIAKEEEVQIILSVSIEDFMKILKESPNKRATMIVSNKTQKVLYYLAAGEGDCSLIVAQADMDHHAEESDEGDFAF